MEKKAKRKFLGNGLCVLVFLMMLIFIKLPIFMDTKEMMVKVLIGIIMLVSAICYTGYEKIESLNIIKILTKTTIGILFVLMFIHVIISYFMDFDMSFIWVLYFLPPILWNWSVSLLYLVKQRSLM